MVCASRLREGKYLNPETCLSLENEVESLLMLWSWCLASHLGS